MNRIVLLCGLVLALALPAAADVTVKKDGNVYKVTWTYIDPAAKSVGLIGDFVQWNPAKAIPMKRDSQGIWSLTLDGKLKSVYLYKFYVDGKWIEDDMAPEVANDSFGATNGKVVVADLANDGLAPPGAKETQAAGTNPATFGYRLDGGDVVFIFNPKGWDPKEMVVYDAKGQALKAFSSIKTFGKVALGLEFTAWKPSWQMNDEGDGTWQLRLPLGVFADNPSWEFAFFVNGMKISAPPAAKNRVPGLESGVKHLVFAKP